MIRSFFIVLFLLLFSLSHAQNIAKNLQEAYKRFEADSQLRHAVISLYIIDAVTGKVVFDKNSRVGMAPASTQKIITSATAFELLGKDYRYQTVLGYEGQLKAGTLDGNIFIQCSGDPSFGSWRYVATTEEKILTAFADAIEKKGIKNINGKITVSDQMQGSQRIPDGWIWQDVGNYYGAGAKGINWRENQYDIVLQSGNAVGDAVKIVRTIPELVETQFIPELRAAGKGSGDNAYIYLAENGGPRYVRGTIPLGENAFTISGAMTDPGAQLIHALQTKLAKFSTVKAPTTNGGTLHTGTNNASSPLIPLVTYYSPTLDSLIYWFNKRSINLYGEALVKTFAFEKTGTSLTDTGVAVLKRFWKGRGLDENELNMYDGSGLSPLNRVTTHAQVEILKYARSKDWFPNFFAALPEFNNMKMKSGTISDVKGFCGYHTSKDGKEYIFSFLVNNYSGRSSHLVNKMYKVLDILKE